MSELTSPIGLFSDVKSEFGSSTKPATDSLNNYYDAIFGSGTSQLSAFVGTGSPSIGNATYSESNIGQNSADVQTIINFDGGLTNISYYFEYDTDSGFGSPSTTSTQQISATTTLTDTISGLSADTTYYYRAVVYNNYNSNSNDHTVDVIGSGSFTTDPAPCDPPVVDGTVFQSFGFARITWTEPTSTPSNGYDIYYSVDGGGYQFKTNVSTGTTQYEHQCSDGDFSNGDDVRWRVRSNCGSGNTSIWDYTNEISITTC